MLQKGPNCQIKTPKQDKTVQLPQEAERFPKEKKVLMEIVFVVGY